MDALTIILPFVQVFAHDKHDAFLDIELSILNQNLLDSLSKNILDRKYAFKDISLKPNATGVAELFEKLDAGPKYLDDISSEKIFMKQEMLWESKYALMILFEGHYLATYPPHYFRNAALKGNTIMIVNKESKIDLRLLMINTESMEVVFYDRVKSSQYDPRLPNEIVIMVKKILKKIYYK